MLLLDLRVRMDARLRAYERASQWIERLKALARRWAHPRLLSQIAAHMRQRTRPRTSAPYERTSDELTLDQIKRITMVWCGR